MSTFPWALDKWLVSYSNTVGEQCLRCSRGTLMAGCLWPTGIYILLDESQFFVDFKARVVFALLYCVDVVVEF